jgi:hypothetical protein
LVFAVAACSSRAGEKHDYLFRGAVVPLSAAGETKSFAHSREDWFTLRLRVTEILAGKGSSIQKGRDYVFGIHSIVLTFGNESLKDVEGKEFIWLLSTATLKDGTEAGSLQRGEAIYRDYKNQLKTEANQAAEPTRTAGTPPADAGDRASDAPGSP